MTRRLLFVVVALCATVASAAPEARVQNPDFTGHWELDLKRSTDPTALLEVVDANFMIRKLAPHTSMRQDIVQHKDRLEIDRKALIFSEHMTLYFDGRKSQSKDLNQREVTVTSHWSEEKTTLITVIPTEMADGSTGTMTAHRYLAPQGHCILEMELRGMGKVLRGRRVFVKVKD